ncbi:MAG: hypothetical protein WC107_05895 [Patescibacteria group bacterium]
MIEIKYSLNTFIPSDNPDDYVYDIKGDIFWSEITDSGKEINQKVGTLTAYLVDIVSAMNDRVSLLDVMDEHSDNVYRYYELLIDKKENDFKEDLIEGQERPTNFNLLIIDRIEIAPKYRGRNIGFAAISDLIRVFGHSCGYVAAESFPLQFEAGNENNESTDKELATLKLKNYYSKLGFKNIKGTDFMLLNLDYFNPPKVELVDGKFELV